ncbi:hypothetical protein Z517_11862 [Fonsecaea pedrosoi CBS 271.37]|uniref:DRBM domain-containing protein n=1 Tax=Fonsecaea pedrosoi CBS 271.37 TaxID=1442368 RepID=A0A0D2DBX4_9EURO|nr:uncharacterized protein Z517_11862 [Fonsecaea pedrosoi CBS 271.37]KIW75091.1 hypothetical protein Z517_11862 [Fonsecaea pedrosoi CBS 271.37]
MLHTVYLASLCQRRRWPEPAYQTSYSPSGYRCVVRVNNREYQTPTYHSSESSAKENAALIAFNICRNFSANDGMYPTGFAHGGVIQGNPVPVGSGRHSRRGGADTARMECRYGDSDSAGSRSGGSSPDWGESRLSSPMRTSPSRRVVYSSDAGQYSRRALPRY